MKDEPIQCLRCGPDSGFLAYDDATPGRDDATGLGTGCGTGLPRAIVEAVKGVER